jgi:O-antigen/teichoic acid export membrane protein
MDTLMVAFILDFDTTAEYILAFFIGNVVYIPFKSIQSIGNSLVSQAFGKSDPSQISDIYVKSAFYSLLFGGFIFCAVWINVDEILLVLNEKFRNGKWVILFIGVAKLVQVAGGVNSAIIVYSEHYKFNLRLNVVLVTITFITNLLLIPTFGMNGAALATLISLTVHAVMKLIFVHHKFTLQPFQANTFKLILTFLVLVFGFSFFPSLGINPIVQGIIKGSIFTVLFIGALKYFKIVPELNSLRDLKSLF